MSLEFVIYEISAINRQIILAVFLQKKLRKRHSFLPSAIHACPYHGCWATPLTTKTWRGVKRVPDALVRAGQLRETTPTEKHRPPRLLGVGRGADNPTSVKNIVTQSKVVKTNNI